MYARHRGRWVGLYKALRDMIIPTRENIHLVVHRLVLQSHTLGLTLGDTASFAISADGAS